MIFPTIMYLPCRIEHFPRRRVGCSRMDPLELRYFLVPPFMGGEAAYGHPSNATVISRRSAVQGLAGKPSSLEAASSHV
jgi:hypothetical protein